MSAGCANCYAERDMDKRRGRVKWGPGNARSRTSLSYWQQPRAWNRKAAESGEPWRVFSASLSDWLDHEAPAEWLCDLLTVIAATPHLTWMLLTKRLDRWRERMESASREEPTVFVRPYFPDTNIPGDEVARRWLAGSAPANVWLGTSVEDQAAADERVPMLVDTPARVRFLSCEPLIGYVDLPGEALTRPGGVDWIIAGGESGPATRAMDPAWARGLQRQSAAAGIAFFMKQLGGHPDPRHMIDMFPEDLRVREFPEAVRA